MASPAPCCSRAIKDANARWPSRKRASDGILGDARHQKTKSDHNLGNAFDLTHDPASGCSGDVIAAAAIKDPRVKYVIWNRQIWNRQRGDTHFRPYKGQNAHTHHCHVSILASARTDTRPWAWAPGGANLSALTDKPKDDGTQPTPSKPPKPSTGTTTPSEKRTYPGVLVKRGMRGELVTLVQQRLKKLKWEVGVDGIFGQETDRVVRTFQRRHSLAVDGEVGRRTWAALFG